MGQDPYFDGSANGLCFSNQGNKIKLSPSLQNIRKELASDGGKKFLDVSPSFGSHLDYLPQQGILMINTALTVEPGKAGSHAQLWEPFTNEIISSLNKKDNIVWILLGNYAKKYKELITNTTHKFVEAVHPSPLSAHRGFFGSKIFSRTNQALKELGLEQIKW